MTTTSTRTAARITAALRITAAAGGAIREFRTVPSGEFYARPADKMSIGTLKLAGLVDETAHHLRRIGAAK